MVINGIGIGIGLLSPKYLEEDYNPNYLTIEALEDGLTASLSVNACEYCIDEDGDWKTLSADTPTESINTGQTISFRSNLTPVVDDDLGIYGIGTFTISKKCNVLGNVMSMLFGDNSKDSLSLAGTTYTFCKLFYNCSNIVSAKDLYLPATTLAAHCYDQMFRGCTSLATAPTILPATTLTDNCYQGMFYGTSLVIAPELPATTLAERCYTQMFRDCISLVIAPALPATIMEKRCYYGMFYNCKSLTIAPALPATTLDDYCYAYIFSGCTKLTTAPKLPATTLTAWCYACMFMGCTSLTTASELPVTIMKDHCYYGMFENCSSLTTAPELPEVEAWSTSGFHDWAYMFGGCTSLTKAPVLKTKILGDRCYRGMFENCTKLTHIEMHATDISANKCLTLFLKDASPTGTIYISNGVTLPIATSSNEYNGIPEGWTVQYV